jgi:transglutaminase-like putative cysteine protease
MSTQTQAQSTSSPESVQYKVTHTTTFQYNHPVPLCQNMVHLMPRTTPHQKCAYHRLIVRPQSATTERRWDYFGNQMQYFAIDQPHKQLKVTSVSRVELEPHPLNVEAQKTTWEAACKQPRQEPNAVDLQIIQYAFPSPHVRRSDEFADYAKKSFAAGRPIVAACKELTERVYTDFKYDPLATTISTPIEEVFVKRRGVCQDLAHVQLACLRSLGIYARYVSGYLRTNPPEGKPRLIGADASHAWLSVYCGDVGWVDFDPTNNCITNTDHITVAWGRDFRDVSPVRGIFVGGGSQTMTVSVDVAPG